MEVYQQPEPMETIGSHCDHPYACEFKNYCHQLPENQDLLNNDEAIEPPGTEITYKDKEAIQEFIEEHSYPIYSLDFETVMYGMPEFDESRPYQQIPFQFSLHVQHHEDSKPKHYEFLGNGKDDPRKALIKRMIDACGQSGPILVYNKTFEAGRIGELIRDFPKYEVELNAILNRLVDLAIPYKHYIKTEATQRRWSLKVVLPTFLPELSYDDLDIQQGMAAMDVYKTLSNMPDQEAEAARNAMLDYCKLDTLAVMELYKLLYDLGS